MPRKREEVSSVKKRMVSNILELLSKLGHYDVSIKIPEGVIINLSPSENGDVHVALKKNKNHFSYFWLLNQRCSVSFLIKIIEELKFLIQYEGVMERLKSKEDVWDTKKQEWAHNPINEVEISNRVRSTMRKTRTRKFVATKSKNT